MQVVLCLANLEQSTEQTPSSWGQIKLPHMRVDVDVDSTIGVRITPEHLRLLMSVSDDNVCELPLPRPVLAFYPQPLQKLPCYFNLQLLVRIWKGLRKTLSSAHGTIYIP